MWKMVMGNVLKKTSEFLRRSEDQFPMVLTFLLVGFVTNPRNFIFLALGYLFSLMILYFLLKFIYLFFFKLLLAREKYDPKRKQYISASQIRRKYLGMIGKALFCIVCCHSVP